MIAEASEVAALKEKNVGLTITPSLPSPGSKELFLQELNPKPRRIRIKKKAILLLLKLVFIHGI